MVFNQQMYLFMYLFLCETPTALDHATILCSVAKAVSFYNHRRKHSDKHKINTFLLENGAIGKPTGAQNRELSGAVVMPISICNLKNASTAKDVSFSFVSDCEGTLILL